jgi:hypothetical protein
MTNVSFASLNSAHNQANPFQATMSQNKRHWHAKAEPFWSRLVLAEAFAKTINGLAGGAPYFIGSTYVSKSLRNKEGNSDPTPRYHRHCKSADCVTIRTKPQLLDGLRSGHLNIKNSIILDRVN